jgi:hypothetical protein
MSYIRSLGNPEGLYVIATMDGQVEFMGEGVSSLPRGVFDRLMVRWSRNRWDPPVEYRGAKMTQSEDFSHWTLTWKDWPKGITAWEVTWAYIAHNVEDRYRVRGKR